MQADDFPPALTTLSTFDFIGRPGEDMDFLIYTAFLTRGETTRWFRAWTGNPSVSGDAFRIFGQDYGGGYAGFWCARSRAPLADQPIVFLGSEGEMAVVARNLSDFLWLLASGWGPTEAATDPDWSGKPVPAYEGVAKRFAKPPKLTAAEVIAAARDEFPEFATAVDSLTR